MGQALAPVLAADRSTTTGLLRRSATGPVPVGTRSILVGLDLLRLSPGSYNDGYADDLSLILWGPMDAGISVSDSPDPVGVGHVLTYFIHVSSQGPYAGPVTVGDHLPAGMTFQQVNASQGSCTHVGKAFTCNLGSIKPGDHPTIDLYVVPTVAAALSNTFKLSLPNYDPNTANNTWTETTTVTP